MSLEEKIVIQIEDTDKSSASFFACKFADKEIKNRAFINALSANLATKHLATLGAKVNDLHNLYYVRKILEEFDIADIELPNIHIDVRGIFDEDVIFIPKKHFEYEILPDIYLILKYNGEENAEILGFIEPKMINKNNANDDYYFVEKEKLSSVLDLRYYIENNSSDTQQHLSEDEITQTRDFMFEMLDNNLEKNEVKDLLKTLLKSDSLRNDFIELENFETISYSAINSEDIVRPEIKPVEVVESYEFLAEEDNLSTILEPQVAETDDFDENSDNNPAELEDELQTIDENSDDNLVELEDELQTIDENSDDNLVELEDELQTIDENSDDNLVELEDELQTIDENQDTDIEETIDTPKFTEDESVIEGLNSLVLGEIDSKDESTEEVAEVDFDTLPDLDDALNDIDDIIENTTAGSTRAEANTAEAVTKIENYQEIPQDAEKFVDDLDMLFHDENGDIAGETSDVNIGQEEESELNIPDIESDLVQDESAQEDSDILNFNIDDIDIDSLAANFENTTSVETEKLDIENIEIQEVAEEDSYDDDEVKLDINDVNPQETDYEITEEIEEVEKFSLEDTEEISINTQETDETEIDTLSFEDLDSIEEIQKENSGFGTNLLNSLHADETEIIPETETVETGIDFEEIDTLLNIQSGESESTQDVKTENEVILDYNEIDNTLDNNEEVDSAETDNVEVETLSEAVEDETIPEEISSTTEETSFESFENTEVQDFVTAETEVLAKEETSNIIPETTQVEDVEEENFNNQDIAAMEEITQEVFNIEEFAAMEEATQNTLDAQDLSVLEAIEQTISDNEVLFEQEVPQDIPPEEESLTSEQDNVETFNQEGFDEDSEQGAEEDLEMLFDENLTDEKIPEKYEEINHSKIPGMALSTNKSNNNKNLIVITASLLAVCIVGGFAFSTKTSLANKKLQNIQSPAVEQSIGDNIPAGDDLAPIENNYPSEFPDIPEIDIPQTQPPTAQVAPQKAAAKNTAVNQLEDITPDIVGSSSTNSGLDSYLTVKSISWQVPDYLSYSDAMKNYLRTAGKSIKLQLSSDLLLASEYAYSNKVKVSIKMTNNGAIQNATVTTSSGSKQIDNIVLQSVKSTLNVIKPPSSVIKTPEFSLTITINL